MLRGAPAGPWGLYLGGRGSVGGEQPLELGLVLGEFKRHHLAHFHVRQAARPEQRCLAREFHHVEIDDGVGVGHEDLVLEDVTEGVARRRVELVEIGLNRLGGHGLDSRCQSGPRGWLRRGVAAMPLCRRAQIQAGRTQGVLTGGRSAGTVRANRTDKLPHPYGTQQK